MAVATSTRTPHRTFNQRMEALKRANDIRCRRARLKRDLKAKQADLGPLVVDPPEWLLSAYVFELLLALPKVGRVKANRFLTRHQISPSKTVGGLSARQRSVLYAELAAD